MGIVSGFGKVRAIVAGGALVAGLTASAIAPSAVSADPDVPLNQTVTATTHLAKLNRDVVNTGTFVGTLDFATGEIVGDLSLGATETELELLGLPSRAPATSSWAQARPRWRESSSFPTSRTVAWPPSA